MPRIMTLDVEMPVLGGKGVLQAMQDMAASAAAVAGDASAAAAALSLSPQPGAAAARGLDTAPGTLSAPTQSRSLAQAGGRATRREVEPAVSLSEASARLINAGLPAVIVVTGNARTVDRDELLALGAVTVLAKPIDPDQLASLLTSVLAAAAP
jgi:CheY-like chemotaxis protein